MFSKKNNTSTETCWEKIARVKECIEYADAVVIGAGAGLSASAGLSYGGERFERLFLDYRKQYGLSDMYSAAFYPHKTQEEFWAYMSRHIYHNRYEQEINDTYKNLLHLVKDKNYFVITTNVDHLFQNNGFDKGRLFYTQGDYGLFQCSVPCHNQTYDNKELIYEMVKNQKDFKIPTELIPLCPKCGKPMTTNLRKDNSFVQDNGWHNAMHRYSKFIAENKNKRTIFLELGVGFNTPSIIKYPFWQMTYNNKNATFISINRNESICAKEIMKQSILIEDDIGKVIANHLEQEIRNGTYVVARERLQVDFFHLMNEIKNSDIIEVRTFLESYIVESAALHHTEEDIKNIELHLEERNKLVDEIKENTNTDIAFHKAIAYSTHNLLLYKLYEYISDFFYEFIANSVETNINNQEKINNLHTELVSAIKANNIEKSKEIMSEIIHI